MKIKLIFHGILKKYNLSLDEIDLYVDKDTTVGQLIAKSGVPTEEIAFAAVNGSRSSLTQKLQDGDEVKLFQFVGGG